MQASQIHDQDIAVLAILERAIVAEPHPVPPCHWTFRLLHNAKAVQAI